MIAFLGSLYERFGICGPHLIVMPLSVISSWKGGIGGCHILSYLFIHYWTVLFRIVPYCTVLLKTSVLCCVVLCCVVMCCVVLCCVVLCCVALCCVVLYCVVLYYIVLCCVVLCCDVLCCLIARIAEYSRPTIQQ